MGELVWRALSALAGNFIAAAVLLPVGLIFLAYLVYIVVMTIRELRKNEQRQKSPRRKARALLMFAVFREWCAPGIPARSCGAAARIR